ncbi:hypothetical protein B5V03_01775 [Bradyrhizobium betae]|uniref:FAD-binding domain-containing protein n=1 Tax=Bradyrhizobium betae TaxID=244734 RepID=A0A4Q1VPL0_9BRAD|nr:FAD-dependent monooxygenase [Bradyrhizobium betae]RXT54202.1 hypothetical protein B5V03_01775 [Bradyrhizobium betae]
MDNQLSLDQIRELIKPISGPDGRGTKDADVLVVGAGPVGLTVVNILGSLGISTILLERNELTSDLPKALVIDDEYLRLLDNLELLGDMEEHLSPPFGIFFYSVRGKPVVKVNPFLTSNGFGNRAGLMQPVFEKKLLHGAQRFPCVDLQYRSTVAGLDQDENGVRLKVFRAGREHRVTGRFVLACDGARSFIRSAVSISFAGNRIDQPHLVVDLAEFPDRSPFSRFFAILSGRSTACLRHMAGEGWSSCSTPAKIIARLPRRTASVISWTDILRTKEHPSKSSGRWSMDFRSASPSEWDRNGSSCSATQHTSCRRSARRP